MPPYPNIHSGHNATAANGKSKFFEVLELALGPYARMFGVEMLTAKARPDAGRPMPELAKWRGVRVLYCTEPNHGDIINSGILKQLTGGEKISYRNLFSNKVERFTPQYKMHVMCNDKPKVDGSDSGIERRTRVVEYVWVGGLRPRPKPLHERCSRSCKRKPVCGCRAN